MYHKTMPCRKQRFQRKAIVNLQYPILLRHAAQTIPCLEFAVNKNLSDGRQRRQSWTRD
jgi:hypothetical protein